MPKLNGLQVCRKLKEQENTRHIPIVFLTILDSEQDIIEGLEAGADDYITKPFSPDELSVRVKRVLFRSVRSTIEDLLSETITPDSKTGCLELLVEKLLKTENTLRNKLRQNMDTLVELCSNWKTLFLEPTFTSNYSREEIFSLVSRELRNVKLQTERFTKMMCHYQLIRWLSALIYRLDREMNGQPTDGSEIPSRLKRMYAESFIIMEKIATARRILSKTNVFLVRKRGVDRTKES